MKNNKSLASLNMNQSLSIKQLSSPKHKKVEGFDKTTLSSTFNSKIDRLKNKPKTEALEDQYIKGLQDQIKYLQLQLKMLQEKDIEKHGQIDQLEKFFGDGIPINENILAIKNGFNNYKTGHEKKIKELSFQKEERTALIDGLAQKVTQLLKDLNENQKNNRVCCQKSQQEWHVHIKKQALLKKTLEQEEAEIKVAKVDNRKLLQKIEKIMRNKLMDNISGIKFENNKNNRLHQLKETILEKEAELLVLQKQSVSLAKEEEEKGIIIKIQEENLAQRKKVIILQRDNDNIKNKIKEKEVELQEKLKERMTEIKEKLSIRNKVDAIKDAINRQNSLTVQQVLKFAKEQEVQHLKRIIDNNKKLITYTDHYSTLLSNVQTLIQNLAQKKPEVKSEIAAFTNDITRNKKRLLQQKQRELYLYSELVQYQQKFNTTKQRMSPLIERTSRNNNQISAYLQERRRLIDEIKIKEKQLQLIFILKGLSFQEVEISKTSNKNIQDQLINFMKNWEKISRNA